jgi:hypothetical protein
LGFLAGGDKFLHPGFYPISFSVQSGFFPLQKFWGKLGPETEFSYSFLSRTQGKASYIAHLPSLGFYALYRPPLTLPAHLLGTLRFGGGIGFPVGERLKEGSNTIKTLHPSPVLPWMDWGITMRFLTYHSLFLECGLDFRMYFLKDTADNVYALLPRLNLGWRF